MLHNDLFEQVAPGEAGGFCEPLRAKHRSSSPVSGAPLGIVTKNYVTPLPVGAFDRETGEVLSRTPQSARADRWALKSVVNRLLPGERVSKCMVLRAPVPGQGLAQIEVAKSQNHGRAFYQGLMACGSVWTCPVCAAKVSERRRSELKQALDAARSLGLGIYFVTLTVPHGIGDDIHQLLSSLSVSLKRLSQDQHFRRIKKRFRIEVTGYIRAQEVTYGDNGWHPHYHIIVFTSSPDIPCDLLQDAYSQGWRSACVKAGLPEPDPSIGCTVQDGSFASDYVTKWGIEDEMTKSQTKVAKRHGLTPWGLLRAVLDGDAPEISPEPAAALFRLYAHAFKGRRQLHWSVGLRGKLLPGNVELSDQELVDRPDDDRAVFLAAISPEDWRSVRRAKAQAALLDAAESDPRLISAVINQSRLVAAKGGAGMRDSAPSDAISAPQPVVPSTSLMGDFRLVDVFRIRL